MTVNAAIVLAVACILIGVIVCRLLNGLADINESIRYLKREENLNQSVQVLIDLAHESKESMKRLERKIEMKGMRK